MSRNFLSIRKKYSSILFSPFLALPEIRVAGRAEWVDMAKAVSIFLVVLWHSIGDENKLLLGSFWLLVSIAVVFICTILGNWMRGRAFLGKLFEAPEVFSKVLIDHKRELK